MVFIVRFVPGNFDICMQFKFEGSSCGNPLEEKISSFKQLCADKLWNRTQKFVFFPQKFVFLVYSEQCDSNTSTIFRFFKVKSIDFTIFKSNLQSVGNQFSLEMLTSDSHVRRTF